MNGNAIARGTGLRLGGAANPEARNTGITGFSPKVSDYASHR